MHGRKAKAWYGAAFALLGCTDELSEEEVRDQCATLGVEGCDGDERCYPERGKLVDTVRGCVQPGVAFACASRQQSCDEALAIAEVDGKRYLTGAFCYTPGVAYESANLSAEQASWPSCGSEQPNVRPCDVLSPSECEQDARCEVIRGRAFDTERACRQGLPEIVGCMPRSDGCPPAIVYAADAAGKAYEFASGCAPQSWPRLSPSALPDASWPECDVDEGRCLALGLARCGDNPACSPFGGNRVVLEQQCIGEAVSVACVKTPRSCGDAIGMVQDAQGNRYWVGVICDALGLDYVEAAWQDGTPELAQLHWPRCNP
jgi:hypothetical protein